MKRVNIKIVKDDYTSWTDTEKERECLRLYKQDRDYKRSLGQMREIFGLGHWNYIYTDCDVDGPFDYFERATPVLRGV